VSDVQETPPAPRRVVVAEDESLIRLDIVEILRDNGFDVVGEAGDGETAVALATELRPDLVIMDVKMPQLDGISAAEKLAKNHIAPVVLLTAFSQKELVERASEAGAEVSIEAGHWPESQELRRRLGALENQRERLARHGLAGERVALALGLHAQCRLDHPAQILPRDVDELEEMADALHAVAPSLFLSVRARAVQARSSRPIASATSASLTPIVSANTLAVCAT